MKVAAASRQRSQLTLYPRRPIRVTYGKRSIVRAFGAAVIGDVATIERELSGAIWIDTSRWPEGLASEFIRSDDDLYQVLADRLRENPFVFRDALAAEFRPALVRLGRLRPDSQPATAARRIREIISKRDGAQRATEVASRHPAVTTGETAGSRRLPAVT